MSIFSFRFTFLVGVLVSVGCRPMRPTQRPRATDLCEQRDSLRALVPGTSLHDHFEIAARLLPGGFGGLTTTYMFFKQPTLADSARGIARTLARCTNNEYWARLWSLVQTVEVRRGDYDWIELRKWYAVLLKSSWDGVLGGGISERTNRLGYAFSTQTALDAFRVRARSLGVPLAMLSLSVEHGSRWPTSSAQPSRRRRLQAVTE